MKRLLALWIIMLPFLLVAPASALYLDVTNGSDPVADGFLETYFQFDFDGNGDFSGDPYANWRTELHDFRYAGQFSLDFHTGSTANDLLFSTYGFCVELTQNAGDGVGSITNLGSITNGNMAAWLLYTYWDADNTPDANTANAALQLAVWDTIYDTRFIVNGYYTANSIEGLYNQYMSGLGANYDSGFDGNKYYQIVSLDDKQDMIYRVDPVPEPATVLLLGMGLLGLAGAGSRRKKAKTS